jgi:hypothetical protein
VLVLQKPMGEAAMFMKNLLPAYIPDDYPIKPILSEITGDENIRSGVLAFKSFLIRLFDRLILEGDLYHTPLVEEEELKDEFFLMTKYPFLGRIFNILNGMGLTGTLSQNGEAISIADWPSLVTIKNNGHLGKAKITISQLLETLHFYTLCGVNISGIDFNAQKPDLTGTIHISYPDNPVMVTGLKALAVAVDKYRSNDNDDFLPRCNFEALMDGGPDVLFSLKNHLHPLPDNVKKFIIELHSQSLSIGLTCKPRVNSTRVKYIYARKSRVIWAFSISLHFGYCVLIKAINMHKYPDTIKGFHPLLQEKIAKGYGCYRKTGGTYCNGGCQGFRFLLDDSILAMGDDIKIWLKKEIE